MNIETLLLACFLLGTFIGICISITLGKNWRLLHKNKISIGDIVLFVDNTHNLRRNMITTVLDIFPEHGTAIIRYERTTTVVSQKHLQVLHLDPAFPLLVPEVPHTEILVSHTDSGLRSAKVVLGQEIPKEAAKKIQRHNSANFRPIPLLWFKYGMGIDGSGKVCAY